MFLKKRHNKEYRWLSRSFISWKLIFYTNSIEFSRIWVLPIDLCTSLYRWRVIETSHQSWAMRGIFAILILLLSITSATSSKSRTKRMRRFSPSPSLNPSPSPRQSPGPILKSNNLLIAHSAVLAMNRRYYLRGSSGVVLAHFSPLSYGIKTNSGHQEGRGVMTQTCW